MTYTKNYIYSIKSKSEFEKRIKQYFEFYNFNVSEENGNSFLISKKSTLLAGWNLNPLKWKSIILIKWINEEENTIAYRNEGNETFDPTLFPDLYETFFTNLISFVNHKTCFKQKNRKAIKKTKMMFLPLISVIIMSSIIGFYFSSYLYKLTESKIIGIVTIIICITASLKLITIYVKRKNILKQQFTTIL